MSEPVVVQKHRISSIDLLRGIVMVIMAIDHVRDYFHESAFQPGHDPLDPKTTTAMLFFTRFITHFCAPAFIFLAGTSAYLSGLKKTKAELSSFLVKRGFWLIIVEIVVVTLVLTFNPLYNAIVLQVIWATGISMVILGLVVRLPYTMIFIIGTIIVLGHNLMDYPEAAWHHQENLLWRLMHDSRNPFIYYAPDRLFVLVYPFLPWTGVMLMGYCTGKLFAPSYPASKRKRILVIVGLSLTALFGILRMINQYGDPNQWIPLQTAEQTFFGIMRVAKYPPSLMYLCITMGPALILLAYLENVHNKLASFLTVFGRVPFFYYVLHFFLIHCIGVIAFFIAGYGTKDIIDRNTPFLFRPQSFGLPLWAVYLIWLGVILMLYPICKKYNQYKSTHTQWWLSYL